MVKILLQNKFLVRLAIFRVKPWDFLRRCLGNHTVSECIGNRARRNPLKVATIPRVNLCCNNSRSPTSLVVVGTQREFGRG